ncbi:DUF4411 family protein [Ramlibacter sp. XY19]|uniref:DUF4411 family protein n=1 Tax=Ramlibacter paludis TaxID=2908000 RepID=UPI0023DAEE41|nr:DUF4411 family protein [Ramlibacter paludis]MCG2592139.1 DUF4411 family protein [Ramlibacter paludis]
MPKYLFDSNVFIQAKNLHYRFGFCGGFWDWVEAGHDKHLFFSVKKVQAELNSGKDGDECKAWVQKLPAAFFVNDTSDKAVMKVYADLMTWAATSTHYLPAAKAEFAGVKEADPFLIAVAKTHGYTIVTHEQSNPQKKNKIPLPDAAAHFGVTTAYVYDVLSQHASSTFKLKV